MASSWLSLAIFLFTFPQLVFSADSLGELAVYRLMVEPNFYIAEPKTAAFELKRGLFALQWKNDNRWQAQVAVGSPDMIGLPSRYGAESKSWGLVEAYGQWDSGLGVLRLGLLPLDYGLEGGEFEEVLIFPRSLIYQKRYMGLRDVGFSYYIKQNVYYSRLTIHNGEGGADLDNHAWFTAKWGLDLGVWDFGLSGQVGNTTPLSTNQSTNASTDELFSATQSHKLRLGNFFLKYQRDEWFAQSEIFLAEVLTDASTSQFAGWHIDGKYRLNSVAQVVFRYDELRFYPATGREKTMQVTLGLAFSNWNKTSNLFIYAIKNLEEPFENSNDRLQINWRWTPMGFDL